MLTIWKTSRKQKEQEQQQLLQVAGTVAALLVGIGDVRYLNATKLRDPAPLVGTRGILSETKILRQG